MSLEANAQSDQMAQQDLESLILVSIVPLVPISLPPPLNKISLPPPPSRNKKSLEISLSEPLFPVRNRDNDTQSCLHFL